MGAHDQDACRIVVELVVDPTIVDSVLEQIELNGAAARAKNPYIYRLWARNDGPLGSIHPLAQHARRVILRAGEGEDIANRIEDVVHELVALGRDGTRDAHGYSMMVAELLRNASQPEWPDQPDREEVVTSGEEKA